MDPLLKLVVDIQNSEKVQQLTAMVNMQDKAIRDLNADLKLGVINQQQFAAAAKPIAAALQLNNQQIKELQASAGGAGRGLSQLAYAVDDVQYGFNAIVNNIPQIVMGLGGGAGIAGAVGIAAVAVNQLIKHWGELTDVFKSAFSDLPIAALKETRLRAEEAAEAFERLAKTQTKGRAAEGAANEAAIVEAGVSDVVADLAGAIAGDAIRGAVLEKPRAGSSATAPGVIPTEAFTSADAAAKKVEADRKEAERLLGQAQSKDPATRDAALSEIGRLHPELGKKLAENTPEAQAKRKQDEQDRAEEKQWLDEVWKIKHEHQDRDKAEEKQWRAEVATIQQRQAQEAKTKRIQGLEDQREAVMGDIKALRDKKDLGHGQILGGAKEALDMYQKASPVDTEKIRLLKLQADKLKLIEEQLKRERRGPILGK